MAKVKIGYKDTFMMYDAVDIKMVSVYIDTNTTFIKNNKHACAIN